MNHASVKLVLRESKIKKDGTAPIWIRITANRKSTFKTTGINIEPKYWNERKHQVRASHPLAPTLNARLTEIISMVQTEALDTPSAKAVKNSIESGGGSFTGYFQQYIDGLHESSRFWDWKKYRVTLKKLTECLGDDIAWKELDSTALIKFERHLRDVCGNSPNTIRKELQRMSRVMKRAIKDGIIKPDADPFYVYDRPKGKPPERRKLTIEEIKKLEALDLEFGSSLCTSRDAFILSFYGGGIRFGDVCRLRAEHIKEGRLEYRMMKTGTPVSIPLPLPALEIINRYIDHDSFYLFPFLNDGLEEEAIKLRRCISSRNVVVNRDLKKLANLASLVPEGLSFHVARHSFADYARRQSGDLYAVSKTLGHTSLQVTQQYLKSFDRDAVDKLAKEIWR